MTTNNTINFFSEDCSYQSKNQKDLKAWLLKIAKAEGCEVDNINYVFCSDEYLLKINRQYLGHDYYTDIITFQNSEHLEALSADIFISVDRVKDNALEHNKSFSNELHRVLVHGLLHLVGYKDSSDSEKLEMRKKEDSCLSLRDF